MRTTKTAQVLKSFLPALTISAACGLQAAEFAATGPTEVGRLEPEKFLGAVKVTFDLLPTTMSFDLPWHFCSVAENGLKVAHFAAETYIQTDPTLTLFKMFGSKPGTVFPEDSAKDIAYQMLKKTLDLNERAEHRAEMAFIPNRP